MMSRESIEKTFKKQLSTYRSAYNQFIRSSATGLEHTLESFWSRIIELKAPFLFDADSDMAKFTFANGRGVHICTSTKRFHRPRQTRKPQSVTVILGGFRKEYEDPEHQLIPCDRAGKIDCCYFGMSDDEDELAIYYVEQLIAKKSLHTTGEVRDKSRISHRDS